MIKAFKRVLYFPTASYFKFWAKIRLNLWKPKVIVITGSSGKTTLLHLIESQIGEKAKYSHHANSSFGIPFDILGLTREKLTPDEWIKLFILAPFKIFSPISEEKLYIVEADCDRPGEGEFLASLLSPEITLWTNSGLTHSANFDFLVTNKEFPTVEEAICNEFGQFLKYTKKLVLANGDNVLISEQVNDSKVPAIFVSKGDLRQYKINENSTEFVIEDNKYSINFIVPKEVFYSIEMSKLLMKNLDLPFDKTFKKLILPPGRNSVFKGIKNISIIDSTYNATPDGTKAILQMFKEYFAKNKWLVLGDMIELGEKEKEEHEQLAKVINSMNLSKIILIGPRVSKYLFLKLDSSTDVIKKFLMPKEGLDYILKNIKGGEAILFKGARFLEGIIEHLLQNKEDADKLVRREIAWKNRRREWGL
jgi:UDP-N-acetylmuramoyl-tripeptide--D-alanyl-D-alanine ligase